MSKQQFIALAAFYAENFAQVDCKAVLSVLLTMADRMSAQHMINMLHIATMHASHETRNDCMLTFLQLFDAYIVS